MIHSVRGIFCLAGLLAVSLAAYGEVVCLAEDSQPDRVIYVPNCSMEPLYKAKVASDRPGVLAEMKIEEGDQVKHGQILTRLKDDVARATVAIAKKQTENDIEVRLAEKTSEVAKAELDQAKQMDAGPGLQVVTRYELRRLLLSAEQTELQIEQAKNELEVRKLQLVEAEERLKEHLIISPIDGMVTRRLLNSGESVQQGSEIMEITNFKILKVIGNIEVVDAFKIKIGDPVVVRLEDPAISAQINNATFNGTIRFIDGAASAVAQKVRVWAEVENPDGLLLPGLRATMQIHPPERTANAN